MRKALLLRHLLSATFLLLVSIGFAQQKVKGNVVSADDGFGLPGVSIYLESDQSVGTTTDIEGNYEIDVPADGVLIFSFVGYSDGKEQVNNRSTINVVLKPSVETLNQVTLTGSRNKNRTIIDTPVPVDVLDVAELNSVAPQTDLNQMLNYAAPSFSSNTQTISDGTDHIDPASLRGLGPDQVLVLLNGKRRHKTSLININGTFGRGNVGTDLNSIPAAAIDRIEVLRDGAAAQYGSDAIAGVINIHLKEATNVLNVMVNTGANFTNVKDTQKDLSKRVTDGEKFGIALNYGVPIGERGGFINFTGQFDFRGDTNRMLEWEGSIFNLYNTVERFASEDGYDTNKLLDNDVADVLKYGNAAGIDFGGATTKKEIGDILKADNTDAELIARGLKRSDFNMRVGQSKLRNTQFFTNMAVPLGENLELYAFGGLAYRNGDAAGFYRLPNQDRTYTPIYPNGFLPRITSRILDNSFGAGIRGKWGNWDYDLSNTYGRNKFTYIIKSSLNASLGQNSPLEANSGGYRYSENTTNFDMSNYLENVLQGMNVAFGLEYRIENYGIFAGDEVSYAQYDTNGNVNDPTDDSDPNGILVPQDFFGKTRPGAIQVFPGFSKDNELNKFRNSIGGYVDLDADITENWLLNGALRIENYSDFGSTFNYKLATRYKFGENFNIRAAGQTGFRAPALHQIYFNSTSTVFQGGIPQEVGTFSNDSEVAKLLGIPSLTPEKSKGGSAGFTARIPNANLKITVDGYFVHIDDRIVYTGQFSPNGDKVLEELFAKANASRASFFANAINTETRGLDIVFDNRINLKGDWKMNNTLAFTFSKTNKVGKTNSSEVLDNAGLTKTYFDDASQIYLEKAVPRTKGFLSTLFTNDKWNFFGRLSYFGKVTEATNPPTVPPGEPVPEPQEYGAKMVFDLTMGRDFAKDWNITIGANNLFDNYPDQSISDYRSDGRFIWSRRSTQFGTAGRFLFARLTFKVDGN